MQQLDTWTAGAVCRDLSWSPNAPISFVASVTSPQNQYGTQPVETDFSRPGISGQAWKSRDAKKKAATAQLTSDDVRVIDPGIIPPVPRKEAVLIYFDETDLHLCPDKGKGYQRIHQQIEIVTPGTDEIRYLLGGVVYPTGEGLYHIYERKRTMEVENWLGSVCEMFADRFIFLVWDNAKTHTTEMLRPFFEAHASQICPVFLPTYSPWLNLIERLWWQMRSDITRNHFFVTVPFICQAVVEWLEKLPFSRFISLMGIDTEMPLPMEMG